MREGSDDDIQAEILPRLRRDRVGADDECFGNGGGVQLEKTGVGSSDRPALASSTLLYRYHFGKSGWHEGEYGSNGSEYGYDAGNISFL